MQQARSVERDANALVARQYSSAAEYSYDRLEPALKNFHASAGRVDPARRSNSARAGSGSAFHHAMRAASSSLA
jgi:hypothetical protein